MFLSMKKLSVHTEVSLNVISAQGDINLVLWKFIKPWKSDHITHNSPISSKKHLASLKKWKGNNLAVLKIL